MSYEDGSGQIARRPRVNDGPPPVSGIVAIVLAVIAVAAGYLILRSITNDGGVATGPTGGVDTPGIVDPTDSTTPSTVESVPQLAPVATEPPSLPTTGAAVIVANANGRGGSAGAAARILSNSAGFQVTDPTDTNESAPNIDTSAIYYDSTNPAAQSVANSLNVVLGGTLNVQPLPDPLPITGGDMKGAGVLLMLGRDFAEMAPGDLDLTQIDQSGGAAPPPTNPSTATATSAPAG